MFMLFYIVRIMIKNNILKVFYIQFDKYKSICMVTYLKGLAINECVKRNWNISDLQEFHEKEWFTIKRNIEKNKKEFMNLV